MEDKITIKEINYDNKISRIIFVVTSFFLILFLTDTFLSKTFIHPENIDKYPKAISFSGYLNEMGKSFDVNNGEACVLKPLYANLCDPPNIAVSRTRNLNYFFDYVDAQFTKHFTFRLGSITQLIFALSSSVLIYLALLNINNVSTGMAALYAAFYLCLPQVLSLNALLYRSGKILTCFLVSYLFYLITSALRQRDLEYKIHRSKWISLLHLIAISLLILSDEMAVVLVALFVFILLWFKESKLSLVYGLSLIWYLLFRFYLEPILVNFFVDGKVILFGGWNDPGTFIALNWPTLLGACKAIMNQISYVFGRGNHIGTLAYTIAVLAILFTYFFLTLSRRSPGKILIDLKTKVYFQFNLTILYCILLVVWVVVVYLMALRHDHIIKPPYYGGGYYFIVTICLFYVMFINVLVRIQVNKPLVIIILFIIGSGNFINIRETRLATVEAVMGADWVRTQSKLQELIKNRDCDSSESIRLRHIKFIDSYCK
jgi:hypothetical protein